MIYAFQTNVLLLDKIVFRFDKRVEVRHEIVPSFIEDLLYFLRVMELQEYSSASSHQVATSSVREVVICELLQHLRVVSRVPHQKVLIAWLRWI